MSKQQHFEICVQAHFSAAHHLRGYPGDCQRPHGHNWNVDVHVECSRLDELGIGIDFRDVKNAIKAAVDGLDHSDLNMLPLFQDENPTSENIAKYLYRALAGQLDGGAVRVKSVRVSETASCGVIYCED